MNESEDLRLIRDSVRRFVSQHMPREAARKWDKENIFPRDVYAELGKMGVMGLTVPTEYGGQGVDIPATMTVIEELAKRSSAIACPYIMAACYAGMNLVESGSEVQKRALLPKVAKGELLFAYGLSEPNVGGDLAAVETSARREGNRILLSGTKRWCTGAQIADYVFCLARTGPKDDRYKNLTIFLVPPKSQGVTIRPLDHLGIRGVETNDVIFEDVEIGDDAILGGAQMWNQGWKQLASRALEVEKLELSAVALGLAEAAIADAMGYAQTRIQFGKSIAAHQAIRHTIAEVKTKALAMRLMLTHAANLVQDRKPSAIESSMTKLFCCEGASEITLACQRIMGAYGLSDLMDMERYVRDAISLPIVGGSSNMQKNNIANRLKLAE